MCKDARNHLHIQYRKITKFKMFYRNNLHIQYWDELVHAVGVKGVHTWFHRKLKYSTCCLMSVSLSNKSAYGLLQFSVQKIQFRFPQNTSNIPGHGDNTGGHESEPVDVEVDVDGVPPQVGHSVGGSRLHQGRVVGSPIVRTPLKQDLRKSHHILDSASLEAV